MWTTLLYLRMQVFVTTRLIIVGFVFLLCFLVGFGLFWFCVFGFWCFCLFWGVFVCLWGFFDIPFVFFSFFILLLSEMIPLVSRLKFQFYSYMEKRDINSVMVANRMGFSFTYQSLTHTFPCSVSRNGKVT